MDRYVIREPKLGDPQPNQMAASLSTSTDANDINLAENLYYGIYEPMFPNALRVNNPGFIVRNPGQIDSRINSQYLGSYPGSNYYVAGQMQNQGQHYQMQNIQGQQQIPGQLYMRGQQQIHFQEQIQGQQYMFGQQIQEQYIHPQQSIKVPQVLLGPQRYQVDPNIQNSSLETTDAVVCTKYETKTFVSADKPVKKIANSPQFTPIGKSQPQVYQSKQPTCSGLASTSFTNEECSLENKDMPLKEVVKKNEAQNLRKIRSDKLHALHKSGPQAFSGPVEKVLKWHKVLKEIGVLILYEIVAKCVSVRERNPREQVLVIRDENGPAMEVLYYEIDFLLPQLTVPCILRLIGCMSAGSCRLQAYSVRAATGDDLTMQPRRAVIAQQHIARLAKEVTQ